MRIPVRAGSAQRPRSAPYRGLNAATTRTLRACGRRASLPVYRQTRTDWICIDAGKTVEEAGAPPHTDGAATARSAIRN